MTKDEALKMAIEAMNSAYSNHGKILTSNPAQDAWLYHGCDAKLFKALQACKEALEQPAHSPVAWMHRHAGEITEFNDFQSCQYCEPLYTHPAPSWQELNDDEVQKILSKISDDMYPWKEGMLGHLIARAIEQALKEKKNAL